MKRLRRLVAGALLLLSACLPLPGCAPSRAGGPSPMGAVAGLALSIGASVGSYLLIKEISD